MQLVTDRTASDFTERGLPYVTSSGLNIAFFYTQVQTRRGNDYQTRLCVAKGIKGDRYTISHQYTTEAEAANRWPREWALFKQYEDVPTGGTPLRELPGITQSQIAILSLHGLRSIEDLGEISPDQAAQIGMDATRARKIADRWLSDRAGQAETLKVAEIEARAEHDRREMERRLRALEDTNMKLTAVLDAVKSGRIDRGTAASGVVSVENDLPDVPLGDDFFAGGDVVTGNDDLLDMPDPLA